MEWMQTVQAKYQKGATAIEYALIAGLLAAMLIGAIALLSGGFTNAFSEIGNCITGQECNFGSDGS